MTEDERSALRAIEQDLVRTDPAFAARMGAPEAATCTFPVMSVLCALTYICAPLQALLFGWHSALITIDVIAVIVALTLLQRRSRRPR